MVATKYTLSIAADFPNGFNSNGFKLDIEQSPITVALERIDRANDVVDVWMKDALSTGDETILMVDLPAAHDGQEPSATAVQKVEIQQETIETGRNYQATSLVLDVPAVAGWYSMEREFEFPITLLGGNWVDRPEYAGDVAEFLIPAQVIGNIREDVAIGNKIIKVDNDVLASAKLGYRLVLNDGTNEDNLGVIIDVDQTLRRVKAVEGSAYAFATATPTTCAIVRRFVDRMELQGTGVRQVLGLLTVGGVHVPKGIPLRLRYQNNDGLAKKFGFILEYLY